MKDLKQLQQFLTLAETLHFSRTSALTHVSPSTLSRTIAQLEEELGVRLFIRDNRSARLTREGACFAQYARDSLKRWEQLMTDLRSEQEQLRGAISVYCSVTASYSFLHVILDRFRSRYPQVEIKLHTGDPEHALDRIQSGSEDIAMAASPERLPAGVVFSPVGTTPLLFIAPIENPKMAERFQQGSSTEIGDIPLILPETGVARDHINRWLKERKIQPTIYAQVTGNEAIVSMVSLGFGVGVVPQIVLENSPLAAKVQTLSVKPELGTYAVGMFTREKRLNEPLIHAFWSVLPKSSN